MTSETNLKKWNFGKLLCFFHIREEHFMHLIKDKTLFYRLRITVFEVISILTHGKYDFFLRIESLTIALYLLLLFLLLLLLSCIVLSASITTILVERNLIHMVLQ